MASRKVVQTISMTIAAGQATASPPLGPTLGQVLEPTCTSVNGLGCLLFSLREESISECSVKISTRGRTISSLASPYQLLLQSM